MNSDSFESDDGNLFYPCTSNSSGDSFQSSSIPLNSFLESTFSPFPKNLNIIHINAQSIPAHYPDLLSTFETKDIHAVLVSETFLKPCLPSTSYALPGFHLIRNDRIGKGGGGVAIYLRSHIPFNIVTKSPAVYSESAEYLFIELLFGSLKLLLGVFYSPSMRIDYFSNFETLLENHMPHSDHTIIMGDFNTCLIKNDSRSKRLVDIIKSSNLNTLNFKNATHFFPGCLPSLLDLSLVSSLDYVSAHGQLSAEAFSYHDLLYLSYKIRPPKVKPTIVMRRSFKNFKNDNFMSDLKLIDWDAVLNADTIDDKVNIFNSILIDLFDKHAPLRPIKLKHLPAPWLTTDIRTAMAKRNRAKSKYKLSPTAENLSKYKHLRNKCNRLCRTAQRNYINISLNCGNCAKAWKFLNSMGISRDRHTATVASDVDIEALNTFLSRVPLLDHVTKSVTINSILSTSNQNFESFNFTPVSCKDIRKHITAVSSEAIGCDGVSRRMICLSLDLTLTVLSHIINFSLSSGSFPSIWRIAHVLPIPKITNPSSFSHYRPISILPFLSKVIERVVYSELSLHLSKHQFLSPYQSGFRLGHSTTTALIKICDDIRYGIDNQQLSIITLLDFSNAFNTVDHDILIAILRSLNLSPIAIEWFRSYICGRVQCIRANNTFSSFSDLRAGVPQGGILSPLLFSIFINSITKSLTLPFHIYADDLQIYVTAPIDSLHSAIATLNSNLLSVSSWSKSFGLSINAAKSQIALFGSRQLLSKIHFPSLSPVLFGGTMLEFHSSIKNLGLTMDSSLSWVPHISEVSKKFVAVICRLRRWKNLLPTKTKIFLAQTLLLPLLDYADACYCDLPQTLLNKLDRLQNMAIRFIFGLKKYDHITEYRLQLKWLTIRQRRNLHILTLLYTILFHPYTPNYLKTKFTFLGSNHSLNLRSQDDNKLELPLSRTQAYGDSFTVKAAVLWNTLPHELRQSKSVHIFKRQVKSYFLSL